MAPNQVYPISDSPEKVPVQNAEIVGEIPQAIPIGGYAPPVQQMRGPGVETMDLGNGEYLVSHTVKIGGYSSLESKSYKIVQKREYMEAALQMCLPCVEFKNKFFILDRTTGANLLYAEEESECMERGCCNPFHEAKVTFYDARLGAPPGTIVFTAVKPFRCFHCFNLAENCTGTVDIYGTNGDRIGTAKEKEGCSCTPRIEVMDREDTKFTTIEGPNCCFGGMLECCAPVQFNALDALDQQNAVASITKIPHLFDDLLTDADTYHLDILADMNLERTANLLASAILLDYMFFEGSSAVQMRQDGVECVLFNCYIAGCLLPCKVKCTNNKGGGGN